MVHDQPPSPSALRPDMLRDLAERARRIADWISAPADRAALLDLARGCEDVIVRFGTEPTECAQPDR